MSYQRLAGRYCDVIVFVKHNIALVVFTLLYKQSPRLRLMTQVHDVSWPLLLILARPSVNHATLDPRIIIYMQGVIDALVYAHLITGNTTHVHLFFVYRYVYIQRSCLLLSDNLSADNSFLQKFPFLHWFYNGLVTIFWYL